MVVLGLDKYIKNQYFILVRPIFVKMIYINYNVRHAPLFRIETYSKITLYKNNVSEI